MGQGGYNLLRRLYRVVSGYLKWSPIMPFTHASFDTFCLLREWLNQYLQWISALGLLYGQLTTGSATFKSQLIELCHFTRSTWNSTSIHQPLSVAETCLSTAVLSASASFYRDVSSISSFISPAIKGIIGLNLQMTSPTPVSNHPVMMCLSIQKLQISMSKRCVIYFQYVKIVDVSLWKRENSQNNSE